MKPHQPALFDQPCICFNARRLARLMTDFYANMLSQTSINGNQLLMLIAVYKADAPTVCQLASLLGLDQTTVTRNLKVLEAAKKVTLQKSSDDKRYRIIHLTPCGLKAIEKALPLWEKAQVSVRQALGSDFTDQLISLDTTALHLTPNL